MSLVEGRMKNRILNLCVIICILSTGQLFSRDSAIEKYYETKRQLSEQNLALFWRIDQMSPLDLAALSSDIDDDVAGNAVIAMGRRQSTDGKDRAVLYQALADATRDPRVSVRRKALMSIINLQLNQGREFDEEFLMPAVIEAMGDQDIGVCELAVSMLTFNRDPSIFPEVLKLMSSASTPLDMRMILTEYAQLFNSVRAVPALVKILEIHDYFYIWYTSILSLAKLTGIKPVDEDIHAMKWEEFHDKYFNDEHLEKIRSLYVEWVKENESSYLEDPLAELNLTDIQKEMILAMSKGDWSQRQSAMAKVIGQGDALKKALIECKKAADTRLAMQAQKALMLLDGPAPGRRSLERKSFIEVGASPLVVHKDETKRTKKRASKENYPENPYSFRVDEPGSLKVMDLDQDGRAEFIVFSDNRVRAYNLGGIGLWTVNLPGRINQLAQRVFADYDGDNVLDFLLMLQGGSLEIRSGKDGGLLKQGGPFYDNSGKRFEHRLHSKTSHFEGNCVLSFATIDDSLGRDVVIGRENCVIALNPELEPYWSVTVEGLWAHQVWSIGDLNLDGRDEIIRGGTAIGPNGKVIWTMGAAAHFDAINIGDFLTERPGLEVALSQEHGAMSILLCDHRGLVWERPYGEEPQSLISGDFAADIPGLEIYSAMRGGRRPYLIDHNGDVLSGFFKASRNMDPPVVDLGWDWHIWRSSANPEEHLHLGEGIGAINWDNEAGQELLVNFRDRVEMVDPVSGEIKGRLDIELPGGWSAADVTGDEGEELIVVNKRDVFIYSRRSAQ